MPATLHALIPSPNAVAKFKKIYDEKFGGDLEPGRALELATYCLLLAYIGTRRPPMSVEIIPPQREEVPPR